MLRGLGVLVPPLLTVVIFVWVIGATRQYFLEPVNAGVGEGIVWLSATKSARSAITEPGGGTAGPTVASISNSRRKNVRPLQVYDRVRQNRGDEPCRRPASHLRRYVEIAYLRPYYAMPFFLAIFILLVYLLGKFMAAGIGSFFWDASSGPSIACRWCAASIRPSSR